MAREDLHFRLRIPESLKARVQEAAEANGRSMTAEIISRIEWSFDTVQVIQAGKAGQRPIAADDYLMMVESIMNVSAGVIDRFKEQVEALTTEVARLRGSASAAPGGQMPFAIPPDMLAALDALIAEQPDPKPSRPEAIRQVLAVALNFLARDREAN